MPVDAALGGKKKKENEKVLSAKIPKELEEMFLGASISVNS